MLDKLKFFNSKEKPGDRVKGGAFSKRTSSSSGFSSARSERSDSSTSLCSEPNKSGTTPERREATNSSNSTGVNCPKIAVKNFAKKTFGRSSNTTGKSNNAKPTNCSKETESTKPDSVKLSSSSPLKEKFERKDVNAQREKVERSTHKERSDRKETASQKVKSDLDIQTDRSQHKESARHKDKSLLLNCRGYTKEKDKTDIDTVKSSHRVEPGSEKNQSERTLRDKFEGYESSTQKNSYGQKNLSQLQESSLLKENQDCNGKKYGICNFEASVARTEATISSNKSIATSEYKCKETKTSDAIQLDEGEQNQICQSKLSSPTPRSEKDLKFLSPEISTSTSWNRTSNIVESCSDSSDLMLSQVANSNIPKPTAAVKGTSKFPIEDGQECKSASDSSSSCQIEWKQNTKDQDTLDVASSSSTTCKPFYDENEGDISANTSQRIEQMDTRQESDRSCTKLDSSGHDHFLDGLQNGISVAKVSPIMSYDVTVSSKIKHGKQGKATCDNGNRKNKNHFVLGNNTGNQECEVYSSQSSASPGAAQLKTSTDVQDPEDIKNLSHLRKKRTPLAVRKSGKHDAHITGPFFMNMTIIEESDDVMANIKPMQPITRVLPYGYIRGLGSLSSTRNLTNRLHMPNFRFPSDAGSVSSGKFGLSRHIQATEDSSKIYGVPVKRGLGSSRALLDVDSIDIGTGYMSDGEVLRSSVVYRAEDISSGYMSEGGGFLYSRRVASKLNGKDMPSKPINVLQDDRNIKSCQQRLLHKIGLDDSSSISSGLSDAIADISTDDNLTGSSLSSETNQYSSMKQTSRDGVTKYSYSTEDKFKRGWEERVMGKPSNGKSANVEKTDSSMQTESSAFQQMSSAVWKKYLQQQHEQHTRSGKIESERIREKKSSFTSSSSPGGKKSCTINGTVDKHALVENQKSKHKTLVQKLEEGKNREYDPGIEKELRNGRCISPKPTKTNSDSVDQLIQPARDSRKAQGYRTASVTGTNANFVVSKKQANTSNISLNGDNKTGNSKVQSNFKKEKSQDIKNHDMYYTEYPDVNHIQSSSLPRNLSTASSSGKSIYDRKEKMKVSANTQNNNPEVRVFGGSAAFSDSEYSSLGRKACKQYTLMSPTVGGLRERVYGSRPVINGSSNSDYVILSGFPATSRERSIHGPRLSISLRPNDADMGNYANIDHPSISNSLPSSSSSAYAWLRYSGSSGASVISGVGTRSCSASGGGLTEAESMESISSTSSNVHPQIQHARANSLTRARLMIHQRELSGSPRLSRSNSIRSTKSEKLYPSMLQRSDEMDNNYSGNISVSGHPVSNGQPNSPNTKPITQGAPRYLFPLSPVSPLPLTSSASVAPPNVRYSGSMPHYMGGLLSKVCNKEDEMHCSSLSVISSSSIYSTAEDKQSQEIKKLKRELEQANEKVATLTSQLTTNAHMVAAFEQSLSNMTNRLHHLTATAEQKDSELGELRSTIEALSKQSAEAGLTKMALQSMQAVQRSMNALQEHKISRQMSTDSVSSVNSLSSGNSGNSRSGELSDGKNKKKKKGWLRSSFSKAFSRSKKNRNGSVSDVEDLKQFQSDSSSPNSPLLGLHHINGSIGNTVKSSYSSSELYENNDERTSEVVNKLKKQLREKEMVITDIRLEALTSAQQLETLKETVNKMQNEMMNLKQDNGRLQKLVSTKSLTSSQSSLLLRNSADNLDKRLSASECSGSPGVELYLSDAVSDRDGKHVTISVFLGCHGDYNKFKTHNKNINEVLIGAFSVSGKTKWELMDSVVKRIFKEYVLRIDPVSNLGLNAESVLSYHVGEIVRTKGVELPELLPCGYLVGDNMQIQITLKGTLQSSVEGLTFETLIPKSIIQRYVSLLMDQRRIILCGPSGTGKTYLAQKLAEYLVLRNGKEVSPGAIATFGVDHKSAKELRQYLTNVAEQCESSNSSDLPTVIILDNLHHVGSLGEVFNGFLSAKYQKCPYIIGTMNQATCSTTNLQLHHNFRWVLCANHMEPVKGFLGRYLRKKLVEHEIQSGSQNQELTKIIDWMPEVWAHLNKFLETHSSSDVTIGPRLFLSCPVDVASTQVWFTDLWNYSIIPYLLEAVREGLQLYGRRAPWVDPAQWVLETYPWSISGEGEWLQLLRLRPEDVGYESHPAPGATTKGSHGAQNDIEGDPLLNMLMRLQEAASCSSPHGNEDDTAVNDHNHTFTSTDLVTGDTVESTL
ncbi:neuron navigator 3-like isoform X1 [Limulus polyphemus]|uniref:Neuron navigator 3-like isoform X1 n=1 Tax=Limulus polyphemus TaxID=6850 RepID=A0ABM1T2X5_LIMPO|nr:neuron navigator 3-like isoform X1 [Limulus polyphemus]